MIGDHEISRREVIRGGAAVALTWRLGTGFAASAVTPQWSRLKTDTSPPARGDHGMVYDAALNRVLVFGGRGEDDYNDVWSLDLTNPQWSEIISQGESPTPRFTPTCLFDSSRGRLVAAFGQGGGFFNDVWAFDVASSTWSLLGSQEQARPRRRYGAAHAHDPAGDRLIVSHGFTDNGRFDDTWVFDFATEEWTEIDAADPVPLKRCLVRGGWDATSQEFFIFGGQSDPRPYRGDLWALDFASTTWERIVREKSPTARNLYGAAFDDVARRWYIFGGDTRDGPTRTLWAFDAAGEMWTRVGAEGARPSRRRSAEIVVAVDRLVLFGGYNKASGYLNDTWVLNLS